MLYVLVTLHRGGDTNVPSFAPRLISSDPHQVLQAARAILNALEGESDYYWVSKVIVYAIEEGRPYTIWNASNLPHVNKEGVHTVAYVAWHYQGKPHEKIYGDFAEKCGLPVDPYFEG